MPKHPKKTKQSRPRLTATTRLENQLLSAGYSRIVGIDEVGRGAWAGPVAVGAFAYDAGSRRVNGVADSKLLTIKQRDSLSKRLADHDSCVSFGSLQRINKLGIGKTIEFLIHSLIERFDDDTTYFLIDGRFAPSFHTHSSQVIGGDYKHYSVAAASVLAKVARDRFMQAVAPRFSEYSFHTNVGYPSAEHREVLQAKGPTQLHRKSFRPIAELLEQRTLW